MSLSKWQGVHNLGDYQFSVYEECNDSTYSYVGTIFLNGQKINIITDGISGDCCYNTCKKYIEDHKNSLTTIS